MPCSCLPSCFQGLKLADRVLLDTTAREEFEEKVEFLESVPLFANQLPHADLPQVATALVEKIYHKGEFLARQGELGRELLIIKSGTAVAVESIIDKKTGRTVQTKRATLTKGDWSGGNNLVESREHRASIIADGKVVALTISREKFEELDLRRRLYFPKRAAVYEGRVKGQGNVITRPPHIKLLEEKLTFEEENVIIKAIRSNHNIRAAIGGCLQDNMLRGIARAAERLKVPAGTIIAEGGQLSEEFHVISKGQVEAIQINLLQDAGKTASSVDDKVNSSAMYQRLTKKLQFLQEMLRHQTKSSPAVPPLVPCNEDEEDSAGSAAFSPNSPAPGGGINNGGLRNEPPGMRRTASLEGVVHIATLHGGVSKARDHFLHSQNETPRADRKHRLRGQSFTFGQISAKVTEEKFLEVAAKNERRQPRSRSQYFLGEPVLYVGEQVRMKFDDGYENLSAMSKLWMAKPQKKDQSVREIRNDDYEGLSAMSKLWTIKPQQKESLGEIGRVESILENGFVIACFPTFGSSVYKPSELVLVKDSAPVAVMDPGESFGEVGMLYNVRRLATFRACKNRDVIVYAINKSALKDCLSRCRGKAQFKEEYALLLDEVKMLSSLLGSERRQLARSARGELRFSPGEQIFFEGQVRLQPQWYVIATGSAMVSQKENGMLRRLYRGDHFGEHSVVHNGKPCNAVSVLAGQDGLKCLCIDLEVLNSLGVSHASSSPSSSQFQDVCSAKPSGWQEKYCVDPFSLRNVRKLGRGAFGKVILQEEPATKAHYALKQISKRGIRKAEMQGCIRMERNLHSMVDSPFIVRLYTSYRDELFVYMLIEAAEGGCLEDVLQARKSHPEAMTMEQWSAAAMFYVACITEGLGHLHNRKIAHRDLKPGNVLLDQRGYAKLCDLGFARFVLNRTYTFLGTPEYMAPELIDFPHEHDHRVDWWAMGVMTFELLAGQTPWQNPGCGDGSEDAYNIRRSQKAKPFPERALPDQTSKQAIAFARALLTVDVDKRLGNGKDTKEMSSHLWFAEAKFDFDALRRICLEPPIVIPTERKGSCLSFDSTQADSPDGQEEQEARSALHDEDDVFNPIPDVDYFWDWVQMAAGTVKKIGGVPKSYDGVAVSKTASAVRITCNSTTGNGVVRFGLTAQSTDNHNFCYGYWVGIIPGLPSGKSHAEGNNFLIGRPDGCSITLSIDEGAAKVFVDGKLVHSMGPVSHKTMFAKVFLTEVGDTADITGLSECEDDGSNWDSAFCLPVTTSPKNRPARNR